MKKLIGIVFILFASIVQSADLQKGSDATTTFEKWQLAEEAKEQAKELKLAAEQEKEWKLLAEQGDANAQYHVGSMYLYKKNNKNKNNKQAVHWFRKAAEQGHARAQFELGIMYIRGRGVLQDNKQGYMWFNLARYNTYGYNGSNTQESFDIIIPKMTTKSINEAQEMSKKCLDSNYKNCG